MFLNQFSVRVPEGQESGGYVELCHDTQYTLMLRNNRDVRCDAKVEIDGKHVGTWRLLAGNSLRLERPAQDDGRFTFYKVGTSEAYKVGLQEDDPNLGLVRVTFTPEMATDWSYTAAIAGASSWDSGSIARGVTAKSFLSVGGTGLSGKSSQSFVTVNNLKYDYSQQTVIHLRLVAKNGDGPRPLTAYSTQIPPPVR